MFSSWLTLLPPSVQKAETSIDVKLTSHSGVSKGSLDLEDRVQNLHAVNIKFKTIVLPELHRCCLKVLYTVTAGCKAE